MLYRRRKALDNLLLCADRYALKGSIERADAREEIEAEYLEAINRMERLLGLKETKEVEP